jgi:hypothetical protein
MKEEKKDHGADAEKDNERGNADKDGGRTPGMAGDCRKVICLKKNNIGKFSSGSIK